MVKQREESRRRGACASSVVHEVRLAPGLRSGLNTPVCSSRDRALKKRKMRAQVLRMLSQKRAEMAEAAEALEVAGASRADPKGGASASGAVTPGSYANGEGSKEFLSTGRTGRRNAMPDILGQHADVGTADLPSRLEALTTDSKHDQPGTSGLTQEELLAASQRNG
ncbi:uncharacterized protein LOC105701402 isoform X2 [Orussus abietinus]|uniref:uncharacterized protein LOC105701402 isoform X2 n=1 Tax=Orussus abietinus TaxID=222816 RepID=UPI000625C5CF|nr:uncharacterized protein LOC105701402 isoform X2 [Orussus abietinus]